MWIDVDGGPVFRTEPGPFGFKQTSQLETALAAALALKVPELAGRSIRFAVDCPHGVLRASLARLAS
jgi:hypothetical protein